MIFYNLVRNKALKWKKNILLFFFACFPLYVRKYKGSQNILVYKRGHKTNINATNPESSTDVVNKNAINNNNVFYYDPFLSILVH